MKSSGKSNKPLASKRSAPPKSGHRTETKAISFLMLYMTAIFLNAGQSGRQERTSARFATVFLTLFVAIFILNQGQLGFGTIYLLLAQIAPALRQPTMVATLFLLYMFLME